MTIQPSEDNVHALEEYLKRNPEDSKKWHQIGVAYLSIHRVEDAEKAFKRCLKLEKNHPYALGDLGGLYILKMKPKDAVKVLKKCLKLIPETHEYWSALGVAYLQSHKLKNAEEAFQTCLTIKPGYFDALASLGLTYNQMEAWEKGVLALKEANMLAPDNYIVLKALARALMKLKRTDELEKIYLRMREVDPYDHSVLLYLGKLAVDDGRVKEGLDLFREAIDMSPNSLIAWKTLAETLDSLGRTEEAKAAWEHHKEILEQMRKDQGIFGTI